MFTGLEGGSVANGIMGSNEPLDCGSVGPGGGSVGPGDESIGLGGGSVGLRGGSVGPGGGSAAAQDVKRSEKRSGGKFRPSRSELGKNKCLPQSTTEHEIVLT